MVLRSERTYINNNFIPSDLLIENDIISNTSSYKSLSDSYILEGYYIFPGLIDIHLHGAIGYDFSDGDAEGNNKIFDYELKNGITTVCPTTMTIPENELIKALQTLSENERVDFVNLEGPFISKEKCGAQRPEDIIEYNENRLNTYINASNKKIKLIDIAPEIKGAEELINKYKASHIISIAHSNADYNMATWAFNEGVNNVTHLYNGMIKPSDKEPGIVGAALDNNNVMAELICDGYHVEPTVIRHTLNTFGDSRIILISDSMRATGMQDGIYTLGGQNVIVSKNKAMLEKNGALAGSVNNLMDMVRNIYFNIKIPLEIAIKCAAENPAKRLGIFDNYGSIDKYKKADLVITDKDLNVCYVIKSGKVVYSCK